MRVREPHSGTLVNALLHHLGTLSNEGGVVRPGIVHRLDRGTSGALVVARNDTAHRALADQFRARTVHKVYVALLHGRLGSDAGTIALPVTRDPQRRTRMTSRLGTGREARTDCAGAAAPRRLHARRGGTAYRGAHIRFERTSLRSGILSGGRHSLWRAEAGARGASSSRPARPRLSACGSIELCASSEWQTGRSARAVGQRIARVPGRVGKRV